MDTLLINPYDENAVKNGLGFITPPLNLMYLGGHRINNKLLYIFFLFSFFYLGKLFQMNSVELIRCTFIGYGW